MFLRGSRYANATPFRVLPGAPPVFASVRPRAIGAATGRLEYVVQAGDRLDRLARHFYNDARLWWRILDANPNLSYGLALFLDERVGEVILIPAAEE